VQAAMLSEVKVSGFKSLDNFELKIRPGLNVLVGPNGSGKTNIIRFFDFLSFLQQHSLSEAISKAGGAGEIFRRIEDLKIERRMTFRLRGAGEHTDRMLENPAKRYYAYEMAVSIEFSEEDNRLIFRSQQFNMKEYRTAPKAIIFDPITWDFTFAFDESQRRIVLTPRKNYEVDERTKRYFERYQQLAATADAGIEEYLLTTYLTRYFPYFEKFAHDISLGNTYNIVPSKVRQPEDIAQTPVINSDGSGLAATLYHLGHSEANYHVARWRRTHFDRETFQKVQAYFGLVNPNLSDIEVRNDPYENKLKVSAMVRSSGHEIRMPLNLLSDGTIKWLALVTAISTTVSYFAIEEPENYIHPKMQHEFANIVRSSCEENAERFALITTHSETLLNAIRPNEIIVVQMKDGRTFAKSILDPELLSEEIRRTGFGLGYYYVTDAVDA
jgi:predicted ATPase